MVRTYDDFGYGQFEPVELYDMEEDRFQTTNLRDAQPEIVNRLEGLDPRYSLTPLHKFDTEVTHADEPRLSLRLQARQFCP